MYPFFLEYLRGASKSREPLKEEPKSLRLKTWASMRWQVRRCLCWPLGRLCQFPQKLTSLTLMDSWGKRGRWQRMTSPEASTWDSTRSAKTLGYLPPELQGIRRLLLEVLSRSHFSWKHFENHDEQGLNPSVKEALAFTSRVGTECCSQKSVCYDVVKRCEEGVFKYEFLSRRWTLSEHELTSRLAAMDDKQLGNREAYELATTQGYITCLELFTSFDRYTTGTMPPINSAPAEWGSPQYLLSEKPTYPDPTIKLRPQRSIKLFVFLNIHSRKLTWRAPKWWFGKGNSL